MSFGGRRRRRSQEPVKRSHETALTSFSEGGVGAQSEMKWLLWGGAGRRVKAGGTEGIGPLLVITRHPETTHHHIPV